MYPTIPYCLHLYNPHYHHLYNPHNITPYPYSIPITPLIPTTQRGVHTASPSASSNHSTVTEQLSSTNLYIRGLSTVTTDQNLRDKYQRFVEALHLLHFLLLLLFLLILFFFFFIFFFFFLFFFSSSLHLVLFFVCII